MSSRPTRARTQTTYVGDSDPSDPEDTPRPKKPQRPTKKKRISDVFIENMTSNELDDVRTPLKSVDFNDDSAEKRRRRRSTKLTQPSLGDVDAAVGTAVHDNGIQVKANQLNAVEDAPIINVPLDVMSSNFEEWMKMATDNKINAANSWKFALIDYFHDMSLLRNVTDNSINFQKASCTLDGCVKIWTSRVDSVGAETGKLLSNLASEGRRDDDLGDAGEGAEPDAESSKKRTKSHRTEATLAKNTTQLRTKKLELEFTVDPLFKKTCADFDESGAQGLLMNHLALGLGGSLRIVFDAGDSAGDGEAAEEVPEEPEDLIDLNFLRKEFLPSLEVLDEKAISHSLEGFSFQRDAFNFDDVTYLNTTTLDDYQDNTSDGGRVDPVDDVHVHDDRSPEEKVEDFFVGDQAVYGDYGEDNFSGVDGDMEGLPEGDSHPVTQGDQLGARPNGVFEPFDPRRVPNERDLVMAMTEADKDGGMMDYFDKNFLKNWAGPEHWKIRKIVRKTDSTEPAAPKAKREKKEVFKIDFSFPLETSVKDLFAPVTGRGGGITLPASKNGTHKKSKAGDVQTRYDQTLPDDMHFSSRQLVTLFLKPKFTLKMRGYRVRINEGDGEVDENFWAQAAADQAAGLRAGEADETVDGGAIPFNTQFFHDDYEDGPGFDDVYEGDGDASSGPAGVLPPEDQDLLAATQGQGRRIRLEFVKYAKRAKRVDVRKLKENIWKGLNIVVSETPQDGGEQNIDDEAPTDPSEARVFDTVITNLQESYPQEKMEEISTSFCFICLLHLANERGLKIEVGEKDPHATDGDSEEERRVGDLWGLKVYRDPNATPAA